VRHRHRGDDRLRAARTRTGATLNGRASGWDVTNPDRARRRASYGRRRHEQWRDGRPTRLFHLAAEPIQTTSLTSRQVGPDLAECPVGAGKLPATLDPQSLKASAAVGLRKCILARPQHDQYQLTVRPELHCGGIFPSPIVGSARKTRCRKPPNRHPRPRTTGSQVIPCRDTRTP